MNEPVVIVDSGASCPHTCEICKRPLEIDAVHKCNPDILWLQSVDRAEANYQAQRRRNGGYDDGWRGD